VNLLAKKGFPNKSNTNRPGANVDRDNPKPKVIKGNDLRVKSGK
jgi:hypothetical protein